MKNEKGFSVIELMIVVAIIGITIAIAIPSYQRYQARVRQNEAKVFLSDLFIREVAYSSEALTFSACLFNIGFVPVADRMYYTIGFRQTPATADTCGPRNNKSCSKYWIAGDGLDSAGTDCDLAPAAGGRPAQTVPYLYSATARFNPTLPIPVSNDLDGASDISQVGFVASASGSISDRGNYDVWRIDQNKNLVNSVSGN